MVAIRKVSIQNFRALHSFEWLPSPGVNCLVGPGDSGKTTVLDAVELALTSRRSARFTDADFHEGAVDKPIIVDVTVGDLDGALLNLEAYGALLRSFDGSTGTIQDEPHKDGENVLTVRLRVEEDLEPTWSLYSERTATEERVGNLRWDDRRKLAAVRIGATAEYHLAWRQGSVFSRLAGLEADVSRALAKAGREARTSFGKEANGKLAPALETVENVAKELGVRIDGTPQALIDPEAVALNGGSVALHGGHGTPLRVLGLGSLRLLIAGLQRHITESASVVLVDEVEHGLEPHRILRLLHALGSKDPVPKMQVFMTTHSPVTVRELGHHQLHVIRPGEGAHQVLSVSRHPDLQGTIRLNPEALLATSVLVCEGATEVGLLRGLDLHRTSEGKQSMTARGIALVDAQGTSKVYGRALDFMKLGYRTVVLRDDDAPPNEADQKAFVEQKGESFVWHDERALEDEMFHGLTPGAVAKLVEMAVELHGEGLVNDHIKSASSGAIDLNGVRERLKGTLDPATRERLAKASKAGKWFKTVTHMEDAARGIIGPDLPSAEQGLRQRINKMLGWIDDE